MLQGNRKRQSEHQDIYSSMKLDKRNKLDDGEDESKDESLKSGDPFQAIKEGINLDPKYELYLETEKAQLAWYKKIWPDPMEGVADKIRKAIELNDQDRKAWVQYNYLALPLEEQEKIKQLYERQTWFWRRAVFILPPLFYCSYAVLHFQMKKKLMPNLIFSGMICYWFVKVGLYSSEKEMSALNDRLYDQFKDEVRQPQFRGLKLPQGKRVYQIDNKEFTSSNLDDLKELIMQQRR